jgi:hypothetical protein
MAKAGGKVAEDLPEGLRVRVRLEAYQRPGQPKTLLVVVKNIGDVPAPKLSVHWVYANETPQPMQIRSVQAMGISGTLRLDSPSAFKGTLAPGREVSFLLDERTLQPLLGQVAALSPERYGIVVASGELEVGRLEGSVVGDFLEKLDDKPVAYEFVPEDAAEDPESLLGGFAQLKEQYPSVELFTLTVSVPDDPMGSNAFLPGLSPFLNKVNACEFEGKAPGTVWFAGPKSSGDHLAKLAFLYRPEGWNKEFREESGRWEEVVFAGTGRPRYEAVDFTPLAAMRTKGWH